MYVKAQTSSGIEGYLWVFKKKTCVVGGKHKRRRKRDNRYNKNIGCGKTAIERGKYTPFAVEELRP